MNIAAFDVTSSQNNRSRRAGNTSSAGRKRNLARDDQSQQNKAKTSLASLGLKENMSEGMRMNTDLIEELHGQKEKLLHNSS